MVVHFQKSAEEVSNIVLLNFSFKKFIFDFYSMFRSKNLCCILCALDEEPTLSRL